MTGTEATEDALAGARLALRLRVNAAARARAALEYEKGVLRGQVEAFELTVVARRAAVSKLTTDAAVAEAALKVEAEAFHAKTGEAKPVDGVVVKEFTVLRYDAQEAEAWTKEKGMCRIPETMDVEAFEKVALAMAGSSPLPFVKVEKEPRVTLAKTLPITED